MDKLSIKLEHCYGIKALNVDLDFSSERVYALYAPNGVMKSSLAETFQDVADDRPSEDRIFPDRVCVRDITDENGNSLSKESVLVVRPYADEFGDSAKTSTLLVDSRLRKEYENLHLEIDKSAELLLKALKEQSGSKLSMQKEISSAFTSSEDEFYPALRRIKNEVAELRDTPFAEVDYDKIFDPKVLTVLSTKEEQSAIEGYVRRYNELLGASTYFKKGTFDYYNAGQIAKSLADNGFFDAKHTVNLNATEKLEITTQKELENVIEQEKQAIIKDAALRKEFDKFAKQLEKNVTLRDCQHYLLENEALLSQLGNVKKFKEDVLKSYLKKRFDLYDDLMKKFESAQKRKLEIEAEAAKQRTQWEEVIQIFNDRFTVPFKLNADNRTAVVLGYEPVIELGFTYLDGEDQMAIDKTSLLQVLSTGERKALYILNVIFEIRARRKEGQETLIVVDDIADSFDYQNKYAIIQYLTDIGQDPLFKQIIMTHNFDFFRIIESRFVSYNHCLMALKDSKGVSLVKARGIKNVFINDWKKEFFEDSKKKIASIPFIRNLIEYTKGKTDPDFLRLTSLLHCKADSTTISVADLDAIFIQTFGGNGASPDSAKSVIDLIHEQANECLTAAAGINFENKIVLAIAIRLGAEGFMVEKINDPPFVAAISSNQTQELVAKFKELFGADAAMEEPIKTLDKVILMTPENIHLNSFMYEPIVDMSDEHLRKLYAEVMALGDGSKTKSAKKAK